MQTDLRLCWSHIPHCWKYHALAQIIFLSDCSGQQEFSFDDNVLLMLDAEEPETWSETSDKKVGP